MKGEGVGVFCCFSIKKLTKQRSGWRLSPFFPPCARRCQTIYEAKSHFRHRLGTSSVIGFLSPQVLLLGRRTDIHRHGCTTIGKLDPSRSHTGKGCQNRNLFGARSGFLLIPKTTCLRIAHLLYFSNKVWVALLRNGARCFLPPSHHFNG